MHATEAAPVPPTDAAGVAFVLRLGRALHVLGHPSHRVEEMLDEVSDRLGLRGQFFVTPTSVFAAFGVGDHQRTFLERLEPGDLHLERLTMVHDLVTEVCAHRVVPEVASRRLDAIFASPPPYSVRRTIAAFAVAAGAAARFLGGGLPEVLVAALVAAGTGWVATSVRMSDTVRRMFEPLAAFAVSLVVTTLATGWPLSTYVATLGGLMVLLPGLALSAAMAELSTQHLVSGTARLTGAFVRFLGLGFGVALGAKVAGLVLGSPPRLEPSTLPGWTEWIALALAPLAFVVLLRARPRDAGVIVGVGVLTFVAGRVGAATLGPELGVFAGAFAAALASHAIARARDIPSTVMLAPALLLLVPGSIGFRSLALLLDREVVNGVEAAFRMILMFSAIVAGLLMAGAIVPWRSATRRDAR